jgi:hypothetical protein
MLKKNNKNLKLTLRFNTVNINEPTGLPVGALTPIPTFPQTGEGGPWTDGFTLYHKLNNL